MKATQQDHLLKLEHGNETLTFHCFSEQDAKSLLDKLTELIKAHVLPAFRNENA